MVNTVYISHPIKGRTQVDISSLEMRGTLWANERGMHALLPRTIEPFEHRGPCPQNGSGNGGSNDEAEHSHACYLRGDILAMLLNADAILMMPGWQTSNGAKAEMNAALSAGIPVYMYPTESSIDISHLTRQIAFSARTFGPGERLDGVRDHIRKELKEIGDATDRFERQKEWIDVIILAFDGAWRSGMSPQEIIAAVKNKQDVNEKRTWPDWRAADPNKAIEHDRSDD